MLLPPAAKYREEFKLIIDRIAVVKSENVSKLLKCFSPLWKKALPLILSSCFNTEA